MTKTIIKILLEDGEVTELTLTGAVGAIFVKEVEAPDHLMNASVFEANLQMDADIEVFDQPEDEVAFVPEATEVDIQPHVQELMDLLSGPEFQQLDHLATTLPPEALRNIMATMPSTIKGKFQTLSNILTMLSPEIAQKVVDSMGPFMKACLEGYDTSVTDAPTIEQIGKMLGGQLKVVSIKGLPPGLGFNAPQNPSEN